MLPASNRGAGMNLGFPDVCLTPAGPAVVPVPYPNIAMNAQALGFSPVVKVSGVNALNMGSKIPMTSGDEAGTANPTIKGSGAYTMGNPIVFVDKLPAINLACPTTGNNMNNPIGAVLVPSAVNVTYCRAGSAPGHVDADELAALADELGAEAVEAERLEGDVALVRIRCCAAGLATEVFRRIRVLGPEIAALVLDLRQNPGGDLDAAVALASDLLPEGAVIARIEDPSGDETKHVARGPVATVVPIVLLVDRGTASAAELLAASLQAHARALVVGQPTYGKASAHRLVATDDGVVRTPVARWSAGPARATAPVVPDVELPESARDAWLPTALALALELGARVP